MHGHQAITAGFHANCDRHGMSLYWELSSVTMVGRRQNKAMTRLADAFIRRMSLLDRTDVGDDGLFIILKNTLGVLSASYLTMSLILGRADFHFTSCRWVTCNKLVPFSVS